MDVYRSRCRGRCRHGKLFGLFKGGFKVSLGIVQWYTSSYGTDFDSSDIASPVPGHGAEYPTSKEYTLNQIRDPYMI